MTKTKGVLLRAFLILAMVAMLLGTLAAPAFAQPTSCTALFDAASYRLGATATVTLTLDAAATADVPGNLTVTSTYDGTGFNLPFTVLTGATTAAVAFTLAMETSASAAQIGVRRGDTLTATPVTTLTDNADTATQAVEVAIESTFYNEGDNVLVTVYDPLVSPLPTIAEALLVTIASTYGSGYVGAAAPDSKAAYAVETAAHSGVFTLTVELVDTTSATGELEVALVDTITATHPDAATLNPPHIDVDTALVDDEDAVSTISAVPAALGAADFPGGIYTLTLSATDNPVTTPDYAAGSEILKVEVVVDGAAPTVVFFDSAGQATTGTITFNWAQPVEGSHTIVAQATDLNGNVELYPIDLTTEAANLQIVAVDVTDPVISAAAAARADTGTAAADQVHTGRGLNFSATVTDTIAGITTQVVWDGTAITGFGTTDVDLTYQSTTYDMVPATDLYPSIAALLVGQGAGTITVQVRQPGVWIYQGLPAPTVAAAYVATIDATDAAGNEATQVSVGFTVVSDTTDPTITATTVVYATGIQAVLGDTITIAATATDDVAGINPAAATEGWVAVSEADAEAVFGALAANVDTDADGIFDAIELTYEATETAALYTYWYMTDAVLTTATPGTYTIDFYARDNVGNISSPTALSIEVVLEPTSFSFSLVGDNPDTTADEGWNLISTPMPLADAAIETVFADVTTVDKVANFWGGESFSATYADGVWDTAGGLTQIDDGKGYLVHCTAATTLVVTFAGIDPLMPTPVYDVPAGWSLIGFTSVRLALATLPTDDYLSGMGTSTLATWVVIYAYPGWAQDRPTSVGALTNVTLGDGYWLYCSSAGVLVP